MRTYRGTIVAAALLVGATGCGPDATSSYRAGDLLYLRTSAGVTLLKAGSSTPTFESPTAEPAPDWKTVVRSDREDSQTNLTAVDPLTDETLWERSVPGMMRVKVVSPGAHFVALAPDTGRYLAQPRRTRLVITGRDAENPSTLELEGNYEPEAFSVDGKHLFVVQYLPAADPNRYQVRRLNVSTGKVRDVFSVDKELQEAMKGTARVQEMSPDGTRLYTLYSVNTPEGPHSFVHVLSLDELWAHCIDLPHGFALEGQNKASLGVAPDGDHIYVADGADGMVAELDAQRLKVSGTSEIDLASNFKGAELTVAADGGSLFIGSGDKLVQLSTDDMSVLGRWDMPDRITGIQSSAGRHIYVGTSAEVAVIDTETGQQTETLDPPGAEAIRGLGPVTRGLDPARTEIVCGC